MKPFGAMRTITLTAIFSLLISLTLIAQVIRPVITIIDDPSPANISHITSDGKFFYTCTGGKSKKEGTPNYKINKYNAITGDFVKSYPFKLFNMRSIMYNSKDKNLYIATYDMKIHKIVDLENGITEQCFKGKENIYKNPRSSAALDPNGKILYVMDKGTLTMYNFKDGSIKKTLSGLAFGEDNKDDPGLGKYGSAAVAVGKKHIYTWDAHSNQKKIYAYDKNGNLVKVFQISNGNWGWSLSYANGYVFVSVNQPNSVGLWNGYKLLE